MSFISDLEAGQETEEEFVNFLGTLGLQAGLNSATHQREMALYDVFDFDYHTYEIKLDRRALKTGNVFLEHDSLYRTHATYIVYKLSGDDNFYILDSASVKHLLDNPDYIQKSGGYGSNSYLGTLIPLVDFKRKFKIFNSNLVAKTKKSRRVKKEVVEVS